jgi:hypothetical protein
VHIKNLATGDVVEGKPAPKTRFSRGPERIEFKIEVPPHSFAAFAEE